MALRMMVYIGLLYQDLIKRGDVLADGRLPPILPIVLYNGSKRWTAVTDVADLIPAVPGLVEQFKPKLSYLLIDENAYSDTELASLNNLVAAVFRFEQSDGLETVQDLVCLLIVWLDDRRDLRRMFALWIRAALMRNNNYNIILPQVNDLMEIKVMLSERIEQWALAYIAEGKLEGELKGKLEGKHEGEMLALQKLLSKRFGAIPTDITRLIANAPLEAIERWFDRAIDAQQLADIFKDD